MPPDAYVDGSALCLYDGEGAPVVSEQDIVGIPDT